MIPIGKKQRAFMFWLQSLPEKKGTLRAFADANGFNIYHKDYNAYAHAASRLRAREFIKEVSREDYGVIVWTVTPSGEHELSNEKRVHNLKPGASAEVSMLTKESES